MLSIKEIKKLSYKKHNNPIANYFERPLSYYIIWLLHPLGVTGNQVSLFSILFFIVPFFLIASGSMKLAIVGTSLMLFISVLDCVDGGMAKCRKNKTLMGRYLEYTFHEVCIPLLFFALSIYSYKYFNNPFMLILGTVTVFSIFFISISAKNKESIILGYSIKKNKLFSKLTPYQLVGANSKNLIKRAAFYFILLFNGLANLFYLLFFISLFGFLQYAIIFYSIFYFAIALVKFTLEFRSGFKDYGLE
jgi:phosphatidylglycerophosphate synthase